MPTLGDLFGLRCVHAVFEKEELLVEMVDGGFLVCFVMGECSTEFRLDAGIILRMPGAPAVGEYARDADGSQSIETIRILHDFSF